MRNLEAGTIVDFDGFSAIVVGDNLLLVFSSEQSFYAAEGELFRLHTRGGNDWTLSLLSDDTWVGHADFWVRRDWNGHVTVRYFDEFDYGYWESMDDYDFDTDDLDRIYDENGW